MATDGRYETMPKKEIAKAEKEKRKLQKNLDGIRNMGRLPDALFVVDTRKEQIAVDEARKLKIPVIGIVDTNCDPDQVDFVIPGNDDALRSMRLFAARIADAVIAGRSERESAMAEQAMAQAEQAAADDASRTVRPADLRKPQRPAETPATPGLGSVRGTAIRAGCENTGRRVLRTTRGRTWGSGLVRSRTHLKRPCP